MYMRTIAPRRYVRSGGARVIRVPRVAGMAGFFTPAAQISGAILGSDAYYGLPPGYPCYDQTHDPGMIHGGATTDAWMLSNVTTNLSPSETACVAGALLKINPPQLPPNYNPATGTCGDQPCDLGKQVNTVIPCADGSLDCQPADPNACAGYCSIPFANYFSPTFATDCVGCPKSNLNIFLIVGAAVVGGLVLANMSRI